MPAASVPGPGRSRSGHPARYTSAVTGSPPPLYAVLPFVVMLLAIAILPLRVPGWWESNRNKLIVAAGLGAPIFLMYLLRDPGTLVHTAQDYVSFMVLLAGLYAISGGVLLRGDLEATPLVNTPSLRSARWRPRSSGPPAPPCC